MIDNIKRFATEHLYALIIIITVFILTLLLCLYFWRKSKTFPKIVGGAPIQNEILCVRNGSYYKYIGGRPKLVHKGKDRPLIILNSVGKEKLKDIIASLKPFYLTTYLNFCTTGLKKGSEDNISIKPLVKNPLSAYNVESREFLTYNFDEEFSFEKTLTAIENGSDILDNYATLYDSVVGDYSSCFDSLDFIGQCANKKYGGPVESFDPELTYVPSSKTIISDQNYRYFFKNFVNDAETLREWYKDECVLNKYMINYFITDTITGNIINVTKSTNERDLYIESKALIEYVFHTLVDHNLVRNSGVCDHKLQFNSIKQAVAGHIQSQDDVVNMLIDLIGGLETAIYNKKKDEVRNIYSQVFIFNTAYILAKYVNLLCKKLPDIVSIAKKQYAPSKFAPPKLVGEIRSGLKGEHPGVDDISNIMLCINDVIRQRILTQLPLLTIPSQFETGITNLIICNLLCDILQDMANQFAQEGETRINSSNIKDTILAKLPGLLSGESLVRAMEDTKKYAPTIAETIDNLHFDNADIYPASRLALTVWFLMLIYSNYHDRHGFNQKAYRRMIASYILYVNTFNTYCGVKMEHQWNTDIVNAYVYKKITNVPNSGFMELDEEKLASLSVKLIVEHIEDLDKNHGHLNILAQARKSLNPYNLEEPDAEVCEVCQKHIDEISKSLDYNLDDIRESPFKTVEATLKDISGKVGGMDKTSYEYNAYKILFFYIIHFIYKPKIDKAREALDKKEKKCLGFSRSLSPIRHDGLGYIASRGKNQPTIKLVSSKCDNEHPTEVIPTKNFLHQNTSSADSCAECALHHAIFNISNRYIDNKTSNAVKISAYLLVQIINECISSIRGTGNTVSPVRTNGAGYQKIADFVESIGEKTDDVYILELVKPVWLSKLEDPTYDKPILSHFVTLKFHGEVPYIYDSSHTGYHRLTSYTTKPSFEYGSALVCNYIKLENMQIELLACHYHEGIEFNYDNIEEMIENEGETLPASPEQGETSKTPPNDDSTTGAVSDKKADTGKNKVTPNPMAKPVTNENVVKILNERLDKNGDNAGANLSTTAAAIDEILGEQTKQALIRLMSDLAGRGGTSPKKKARKVIAAYFDSIK